MIFLFKHKTAYEWRISDWSSDVCSSDLLKPVVEPRTGAMLTPQGFLFISSPGSITPYHFDPEHNILLQLRGTKVMNVWPAGDERFAHRTQHERYHTGGHRNLPSIGRASCRERGCQYV